jgi:hypothetical protein
MARSMAMSEFLVRHKDNFFGTLINHEPSSISVPELSMNHEQLLKDFSFHFKDFKISPPAPNSLVGSNANRLNFFEGLYKKDDFILAIRILGISKDGFFFDVDFPDQFYKAETLDQIKELTISVSKILESLTNDIEKFLLNFSGSSELKFKRTRSTLFNAKILLKKDFSSFFSDPLKRFIDGIFENTPNVIDGVKNVSALNLGISIAPEDIDPSGKVSISLLQRKFTPISMLPRTSNIQCENVLDARDHKHVFSIRDVPFEKCWNLLEPLIT